MKQILSDNTLIFGAHFAIVYVIIFITYLWYKDLTRDRGVTFLEIFRYIEGVYERLEQIIKEENGSTRKELFNSELRSFDRIKRKLEQNENEEEQNF